MFPRQKRKLIVDTSVFVNPDSSRAFGENPTESFQSFLTLAKGSKGVEIFMPLSVYAELMNFVEESRIPKILLSLVHKRSPSRYETKVPGIFIYQLVESMRDRIDRGLRLSERHVREALQGKPNPKGAGDLIRGDAEAISRLRESYRRIMRDGFLDSKADVDMLLLAYELKGFLVSADQGLLDWADRWGISIIPVEELRTFLELKPQMG